jgi:hypothetical protein
MTRPDPALLDQIVTAEKYRRRCNGQPSEGILITAATLRVVLAAIAGVMVKPDGVIAWREDGREFTAEPVKEEPDE